MSRAVLACSDAHVDTWAVVLSFGIVAVAIGFNLLSMWRGRRR